MNHDAWTLFYEKSLSGIESLLDYMDKDNHGLISESVVKIFPSDIFRTDVYSTFWTPIVPTTWLTHRLSESFQTVDSTNKELPADTQSYSQGQLHTPS